VVDVKYSGRIIGIVIVIISFTGLEIYHYYAYAQVDTFHIIATIVYMVFALWIGKQFDKAKFHSEKDYLTNTYNRRFITHVFPKLLSQMDRSHRMLCLCLIDIDNFKHINDSYGHKMGDLTLKNLSKLLEEITRKSDYVARWGGDEFIVVAPYTDEKYIGVISNRIKESLQELSKKGNIITDVSVGFAVYPNDAKNLDDLIKKADSDMYQLKLKKRM
jgi:diguanylate cyclase (GGDEF)-like protein